MLLLLVVVVIGASMTLRSIVGCGSVGGVADLEPVAGAKGSVGPGL